MPKCKDKRGKIMSFKELFEEEEFKTAFDEVSQFTYEILHKYNARFKNYKTVILLRFQGA